MNRLIAHTFILIAAGNWFHSSCLAEEPSFRTPKGLVVLYDFSSSDGRIVRDRSGVGKAIDLKIVNRGKVLRKSGELQVVGNTVIQSDSAASKLVDAVRRTGEITIEAWIKTANAKQKGPARIVTLSKNGSARNFTLGQDGDRYDVRFRTTKTNSNGIPSLRTGKAVQLKPQHIVYTRDLQGKAKLYVNGKISERKTVAGDMKNWDESFQLALGNEPTKDRSWLGTYYLVAIYNRDLSAREITQNFKAGHSAKLNSQRVASKAADARIVHFESRVAPVLADRCLQCHDSSTNEGGLNLSIKKLALAGGESGSPIQQGDASSSLLWELVDSNDMPSEGEPLTDIQKDAIRKWINDGAIWPGEAIDPAIYLHGDSTGDIWIQRLTVPEYVETVRATFGVDISKEAKEILPPDLRADGFSNTAYNLTVDLKHAEAYAHMADVIVSRFDVVKYAGQFSKSRSLSTDATMRKLVAAMGKSLLRGPLDEREVTNYSGLPTTVASAGGDFEQAMKLVIKAMLQSPRFIYRIEDQHGDDEMGPVGDYELASRLSYIIWGGPPDKELQRAADAGELHERSLVEAQVQRMLKDSRAVDRSMQFASEWLNLNRLQNMRPSSERFPNWDASLGADMRAETLAFFRDLVWDQNRPLVELLNAQFTYATPKLAKHYGLSPKGKGLKRYELSSVAARGGLLTQGSILTIGGDDASMVTRGLFVLHDLLRGVVKDPPPGLDVTPVPPTPGISRRQIAEQRVSNESCGGCHSKFEPLVYSLERFDGLGAYAESDEHGNELGENGEILFPGQAKPIKYENTAELMDLLAESDRVHETITWKLAQFALGRPLLPIDAPIVRDVSKTARSNGGTYQQLIAALVVSDLVQMTRTSN